jgi:diacylglycerol kinase family enzyme
MRALLVVNPKATATTARARDVLAHALASESRLEVVETKTRGHATELAAAAVGEFDVVVALGGDGTVNEVVNGLLTDGPRPGLPALAVVPGGSTNVFARALGLPNSPVEATGILLDALRSDRRRTIGLARVDGDAPDGSPGDGGGRWFTFNAGLGLDADVVRRVDGRRAAGRTATPTLYAANAVRQFFRTDRRHPALTLERPGAEPVRLGLALVCNTAPWTYVGTRPLDPCPRASFDTGLDVFGLRRLGAYSLLRHAAQAMARTPHAHGRRVLLVHDAPSVVLTAARPLPFQVDGEDVGDRSRVVITGVPAALQVVA